jgi:hypothetical protein
LEEFSDFYTACLRHINECIINGWRQKDSIDWSKYSEINYEMAAGKPTSLDVG